MLMKDIPILSFLLFIIGILIYLFTLSLINGKLFNLYSNNEFPYDKYKEFWKEITSEQRVTLSQTYFQFYQKFTKQIESIEKQMTNKNIYFDKHFSITDLIKVNSKYSNLPFIRVSLIPKSEKNSKKLLICSHYDGHNLTDGGTAYDDAINVMSMLGTIDAITKNDIKINTQIDFLFDGGEEYGLMGAYQYVANLTKEENYDYLNLESMGSSPPYIFVIKSNNGNYRIQKTLSKTRGSILLASNYIYGTKFTSSITDHIVFDEQGWKGGVNVFLGKGSVYHSKYDKINKYEDLKIAGNQLLDFAKKYNPDGYDGNSIGYGIAPICIVFPILVMYIIIPIIFIISVGAIILKERKDIKEFLKDLLKQFLCFIIILLIFMFQALLVYLINPNSASSNQIFAILMALSGFFLFLFFQRIFKIKKWSRFRLILDSLLMIIAITTDLPLPFAALTILSIIFYFFDNKIVKLVICILQILIMSLYFASLIQIFMQYTTRFKEIIGNLIIFFLFFIFSYHISVSPLEFHDISEDNEILKSIYKIINRFKVNNEVDEDQIFDSFIKNSGGRDSDNIQDMPDNKVFDKKYIHVILMFLYVLYPFILLLILIFKPYPFSKDYTVRGAFLNVFRENQKYSSMIFNPFYGGYKYAKNYIKKTDYNFKEEKDISNVLKLGFSGKAFIVNSTDNYLGIFNEKCKNIEIPDRKVFNVSYIGKDPDDKSLYNYLFNFNISNISCINIVYIYIRCKECIKKINGKIFNETKNENPSYDLQLRVGKKEIINDDLPNFEINSTFTLNTNKFDYTILLNTMEISKDYYKFLDSFGEASCNARSSVTSDTIFLFDGKTSN